MRIAFWVGLDAACICLFAAVGRRNHGESGALWAVATTAWPFLVGMSASWVALLLADRRAPLRVVEGVPIWLGTVAIGMVLRALTDAGTALSFIVVATLFLGATLLGWRVVAAFIARRQRARADDVVQQT